MEQKALVSCVAALLLLLQFAGFCLASEAPLQNVENQPEADNVNTPSTTTEDSGSHAREPNSKIDLSAESPYLPVTRGVGDEAEALMKLDTDRSGKLIAQYTTKTQALFVTTTRTALSTCFSATNMACTGRKRKKRTMETQSLYIGMGLPSDLVASQEADPRDERDFEFKTHESVRKERKFTIWTTLFSTHTLTTTFYYPGTTVIISGVCSVPGLGSSCFG